ncbi:DNA-binding protein [Skermania piniformis]|uniref:DNA-binding protein n=1 Tax=Skermania pinensis TaxID=39122 RepID=A0ABX8SHD3_9ACTN|nr:DNA-binding protein [Skermania piniformis]
MGAPATRALRAADVHSLEQLTAWPRADLAALHGVGPIALDRLTAALAELGMAFAPER